MTATEEEWEALVNEQKTSYSALSANNALDVIIIKHSNTQEDKGTSAVAAGRSSYEIQDIQP